MKLSSIQVRILRILLEADEENIPTIVNTIYSEATKISKEKLLSQISSALEDLHRKGLINYMRYVSEGEPQWETITENELRLIFPIRNCLEWNEEAGLWRWKEELRIERVIVTLEKSGRKVIREYLSHY